MRVWPGVAVQLRWCPWTQGVTACRSSTVFPFECAVAFLRMLCHHLTSNTGQAPNRAVAMEPMSIGTMNGTL